jgi:LEA14-like dessication related protein
MKNYLKTALMSLIIILGFLQTGCQYENIKIGDIKEVKTNQIKSDKIDLTVPLPIINPNPFRIVITKYNLLIKVNKQSFKLVEQNKNIIIPKKFNGIIEMPLILKSEGLLNLKTIKNLYEIFSKKQAEIEIEGVLGIRILLIPKKIDIQEKRIIYF